MTEEISINISKFTSNVTKLRTAVSNIESSMKTDRNFEKTNIKPFTDDLETTIEAIELLERYKQMLNTDVDALENVGNDMVEHDEELAQVCGPQPVR